jgi:hypothetical protein
MALKALSAFWTPQYYDTHKQTITKQLVYIDQEQVDYVFTLCTALYILYDAADVDVVDVVLLTTVNIDMDYR